MKELQTRTTDFVTAACRYEREVGQQVESVKLSSESERMGVQVELANARKEAAAAAASHKNALASWQVGGRGWVEGGDVAALGGSAVHAFVHASSSPAHQPAPHLPHGHRQGELDMHRAEVNRLRRELERVEGERDRVQEEARRCGRRVAAPQGVRSGLQASSLEPNAVLSTRTHTLPSAPLLPPPTHHKG